MVKLSGELNLPSQFNDMTFHQLAAQVTDEDIAQARQQIQSEFTEENLNNYLADWEPWKRALANHHPQECAQLHTTVSQQRGALQAKMDDLSKELEKAEVKHGNLSPQYLDLVAQSNGLSIQYRSLERVAFVKLTQQVRQQMDDLTPIKTGLFNCAPWLGGLRRKSAPHG